VLLLLFSARCKPRGRGAHPAACPLSSGGDGPVQQQAQTEAGPPQPGDRRAHVTPPPERSGLEAQCEHTHTHTRWSRVTQHYTVSAERELLSRI